MSLEVECGWTLLRALAVALLATPLAMLLVVVIKSATPRTRGWLILALAVPFLTPGFVVGYSYSNLTLDLVRTPILNELFYDLLLLIEVVPVGVLVLGMAPPPPLGPTARWCTRLTGPQRLRQVASCGRLRQLGYGPARNLVPAAGLMALLVFHEFEIASLFRVIAGGRLTPASWSNALFELIALQQLGQTAPWELWRFGWLPLGCSLILLTPVLLLAWTAIGRDGKMPPVRGSQSSPAASRAASLWLIAALLLGTIIPLGSLVQDGVPGLSSLWGENRHQLGRTLAHAGRSLLPAILVASIAAGVALGLLKHKRLGLLLLLLTIPGLLGGLALGLVLTFCVLALAEPLGLGHSGSLYFCLPSSSTSSTRRPSSRSAPNIATCCNCGTLASSMSRASRAYCCVNIKSFPSTSFRKLSNTINAVTPKKISRTIPDNRADHRAILRRNENSTNYPSLVDSGLSGSTMR